MNLLCLKLPNATQNIHINIIQRVSVIPEYFCKLLVKKKQLTSYLLLTLTRLLAQIVDLENNIFKQFSDLFNLSFMTQNFLSSYSKL